MGRNRTEIGPYNITKFIAEGGFGKTYKAEHKVLGVPACIKHCSNISEDANEILAAEAKAIWDLRHFSIPAIRDLVKLRDGSTALVMSYIEGPTLAQIIDKYNTDKKKLDPEHVAWITQRVLNALWYMHDLGVVHGDIKPQNIIIQPKTHTVVIVDFGLAMVKPMHSDRSIGYTELFSPPEQLRGSPLIPQSDFYSLGMTMLYALSGSQERTERREVPSTTPETFAKFIKNMIVHDALSRPEKAGVLYKEMEDVRRNSFNRANSNMKELDVTGIGDAT